MLPTKLQDGFVIPDVMIAVAAGDLEMRGAIIKIYY